MRDYEELVQELRTFVYVPAALQAADAIEELHRENESYANTINEASEILRNRLKSKWISVEERLPENSIGVLVTDGTDVSEGWLCTCSSKEGAKVVWGLGSNDDGPYDPITHWMPLPEPPKEDKP